MTSFNKTKQDNLIKEYDEKLQQVTDMINHIVDDTNIIPPSCWDGFMDKTIYTASIAYIDYMLHCVKLFYKDNGIKLK